MSPKEFLTERMAREKRLERYHQCDIPTLERKQGIVARQINYILPSTTSALQLKDITFVIEEKTNAERAQFAEKLRREAEAGLETPRGSLFVNTQGKLSLQETSFS